MAHQPCTSYRPWLHVSAALLILVLVAALTPAHAATGPRPCDLLGPSTPCVDAVSTTRALYASYHGPLYQVLRASDHTTIDIGLLSDGYADTATQDRFCARTTCTIIKLYDQSPEHNDLTPAPPGGNAKGSGPKGYDLPARADALPITLHAHKVYGIRIDPGMGYRNDTTRHIPVRGQPEGVYMVTSALHLNDKCCFDYGNAETNNLDNDKGHMDALNIKCKRNTACQPDAGLDQENGIYGHLDVPANTAFVTDIGTCDGQKSFAIYQGDAEGKIAKGQLTTTGPRPLLPGYSPMQQEGAIILGIGGDNSDRASGYFFEGAMTRNTPTPEVLNQLQDNILQAQYSGPLNP